MDRREFLKFSGLASLAGLGRSRRAAGEGGANIVIVVLDAFSGLHLPFNGYRRMTTPNLARLAERATVFHNHYAGGNFTTPGTATLLTGTYPWTHRALQYYDPVVEAFERVNLFALFEGHHRIAFTHNPIADAFLQQFKESIDAYQERQGLFLGSDFWLFDLFPQDLDIASLSWGQGARMEERGYASSLFWTQLFSAMDAGREERLLEAYSDAFPVCLPSSEEGSHFILEQAIDWMQAELSAAPQPFLGYFHLMPPHAPYCARADFAGAFAEDGWEPVEKPAVPFSGEESQVELNLRRKRYDEFILYADHEVGRLVEYMEGEGLLEDTWLVITSDHGEMFERGISGHNTAMLYEEVLRIPLLVHAPGQRERRDVFQPTSAVDLLPSLLRACGKDVPGEIEGRDVFGEVMDERGVFGLEARKNEPQFRMAKATAAIVRGQYKLITYFGYEELGGEERSELYDLEVDPEELNDLYAPGNRIAEELYEELQARMDAAEAGYEEG